MYSRTRFDGVPYMADTNVYDGKFESIRNATLRFHPPSRVSNASQSEFWICFTDSWDWLGGGGVVMF